MTDKNITELTIRRPDDWHLHLRDGAMLQAVLPETARHFGRAIIMPNLVPPVVTADQAVAYRDRIMAALPRDMSFEPLMTLYLTENTDPDDVAAAHAAGIATAVKLYPAGATTNSASGVTDFEKVRPVLDRMAEIGMPLCVHGEVTNHEVDIFDREAVFIDKILKPLRKKVPDLRIIMEHVTTQDAVDYVRDFDAAGALPKLEAFASLNGPRFYGLAPNDATITLTKGAPVTYPDHVPTSDGPVTVFDPGFDLHWSVTSNS